MQRIESFMNAMSDMDFGWWPLLSVRPAKKKDMDNVFLLKITVLFGTVLGLAWAFVYLKSTLR